MFELEAQIKKNNNKKLMGNIPLEKKMLFRILLIFTVQMTLIEVTFEESIDEDFTDLYVQFGVRYFRIK